MNFNKHYELEGKHAFLSASKYHWLNYTEDKLVDVYNSMLAKTRGTELHEFACNAIRFGIRLEETNETLSMYVNDCIDDGLAPEVVLYYSPNAFGTADGISFENDILRIYDLKTGKTPASMKQLEVYAGLFCLEYKVNPNDILFHLRIYQLNEISVLEPTPDEIWEVIDRIIAFDNIIQNLRMEG